MERIGLEPGTEIGGYRIVSPLGTGAMGAVYKAVDGGGSLVAFKLLHAQVSADAETRRRLGREISALQKVNHPAVAHLLDAEADSSEMFIVTALVDGLTLEEEIAGRGPLDALDLFELADQLRDALDAVHAAGVIHRDLKPGNVLISDAGPVLIDFGIAHGMEDARVTSVGFVMGTPGYLAPELLDRMDPSAATDWWGWAAMLVYAATGRAPFGVRPLEAVITRARSGDPDVAGLGPLTAGALRGALAADPALRWSPDRVVAALREAAEVGDAPVVGVAAGGIGAYGGGDGRTEVLGAGQPLTEVVGAGLDQTEVFDGRVGRHEPFADAVNLTHTSVLPATAAATELVPPVAPGMGAPASYAPGLDPYPYDMANPDPAQHGPGPGFPAPQGYLAPPVRRRPFAVLALAVPLVLAGATYPGKTLVVLLALTVFARVVGIVHSSFHSRREVRGARGGDGLRAVVRSPWHAVRAVVAEVPSLLVAASTVIIVGGVAWWALTTDRVVIGSGENEPWVYAVVLAAVTAIAAVLLWFGPVTSLVRHGGRVVLNRVAPGWVGTLVVVVLAVLVSWYFLDLIQSGHPIDWAPIQEPPSFGQ
ncbi:Protein kinase domain-containing protein [Sanguibacter gelidistatuariae]|uniref:Protein kinase domain-containing protein n=1 Tax=Sanguibacter gelidistatuariae TaxID=1814289 RepID=A0A1G6PQ48_9MICO|nr:serine/threonine-protein kinase [Sanguibacter gelidistatuariae]SDC82372.1 Protein kinase domain-containing protein [Sanguibacter gelidistatuariae]